MLQERDYSQGAFGYCPTDGYYLLVATKYSKAEIKYGCPEMNYGKAETNYGCPEMEYGKAEMNYGFLEGKYVI